MAIKASAAWRYFTNVARKQLNIREIAKLDIEY